MYIRTFVHTCVAIVVAIIFFGCKDDSTTPTETKTAYTDTLVLKFHPHFGEEHLILGQPYTDSAGETLIFSKVRFYCSEVSLVSPDGSETPLDGISLVDFDPSVSSDDHPTFRLLAPAGIYSGVKFTVGVPYSLNHKDAASEQFPLGPNSDMYWSWNPGYVFMKLEGTADNGAGPVGFAYHLGMDGYDQHVSLASFGHDFDTLKIVKGIPTYYNIEAHFNMLFDQGIHGSDPMKPATNADERQLHGTPKNLADRIYANSVGMFTKSDD